MSDLRPNIKYTPELLEDVQNLFKKFHEQELEFQREKARLLTEAIGTQIWLCEICHRPMLPRRLWYLLPLEIKTPKTVTRVGVVSDGAICFNHYTKKRAAEGKGNAKRLSADEISRLQERNRAWYEENARKR